MSDTAVYVQQTLGNMVAAPLFVGAVGLIPEPWRQRSMAAMMVIAAWSYWGGGLGAWEWIFAAVLTGLALWGVQDYRAIGAGWLVHTVVDAWHHLAGLPMVESLPMSSFGCMVFDPLIALWFFAGAPSTPRMLRAARALWRPRAQH